MKKLLLLILCVSLVIGCVGCSSNPMPAGEQTKKLVVGMELAYPPFETKDTNGEASGISADFAKALGAYLGYEVEIQNIAWDGLIPALQTGTVDMVISSMTITEKRQEVIDFSDPYACALLAILANAESNVERADDLNQEGIRIAVKTGSTGYFYAEEHFTNAQIIALNDESACVTEVSQGKADAFLYDQLTIYRNWQAHPDTTKAIFIPFQDVEYWGCAVAKGNTELREQINEFIEKYTQEGGWETLTEKYLADEKQAFDSLGFKWFFDLDA